MDDIKLAMLGNKDAAKRLTDAGVLLPCPGCRRNEIRYHARMMRVELECQCGFIVAGDNKEEVTEIWNTRAPILSAEELQRLEAQP